MLFKNRKDAAEKLSEALSHYKKKESTIIIGVPRGGIEIGFYLSKNLYLPLHYILVKKIGHPLIPEYAIGVVSIDDVYLDATIIKSENISKSYIDQEVIKIREKLSELREKYPKIQDDYKNKTIILTDDGIATGKTLLLTIKLLKQKKPKKIVVAIPLGPFHSVELIKELADEVISLYSPVDFLGISQFYEEFEQLADVQVEKYLKEANGI